MEHKVAEGLSVDTYCLEERGTSEKSVFDTFGVEKLFSDVHQRTKGCDQKFEDGLSRNILLTVQSWGWHNRSPRSWWTLHRKLFTLLQNMHGSQELWQIL
jgi:hypothetical protein